jgi:hypothetical protein
MILMDRKTRIAIAAGAAALALAGCGATVSKTSAPPAPSSSVPGSVPETAPAAASSSPLSGPVGTTYTVTVSDGTSYTVTLDEVNQNAVPGPYETPQQAGDHFASARFTITGVTGNTSDDANNDASAIGTDGTEYPSSVATLTVPNFNYGDFKVAAGQSVSGYVAFELPGGVRVASVQWSPELTGQAATWTVGS